MTVFFKGKAIGQADTVLINGKTFTDKELKDIIQKNKEK